MGEQTAMTASRNTPGEGYPHETLCCWCERMARVYDPKPSGYVWYECSEGHLSLWSPFTRTALFPDDKRLATQHD